MRRVPRDDPGPPHRNRKTMTRRGPLRRTSAERTDPSSSTAIGSPPSTAAPIGSFPVEDLSRTPEDPRRERGTSPRGWARSSFVVLRRNSSQSSKREAERCNLASRLEQNEAHEEGRMWRGSNETGTTNGSLPRRHTVDGSEGQGGTQTSGNNLYKTELCRSFEETGSCRYGNKCQFAHGKEELRPVARHPKYKTEVCRTFTTHGTCPYGTRCRFIHYYSPKHEKEGNVSPPITPTQKTPNLPFTGLLARTYSAHAPVERTSSSRRLPIFEQLVAQDYAEDSVSNSCGFLQCVEDMQI